MRGSVEPQPSSREASDVGVFVARQSNVAHAGGARAGSRTLNLGIKSPHIQLTAKLTANCGFRRITTDVSGLSLDLVQREWTFADGSGHQIAVVKTVGSAKASRASSYAWLRILVERSTVGQGSLRFADIGV